MPEKKKSHSTKESLFSKVRFLDIFGQPPIFNIGGEDSFKTNLGVFWTFLLLVILFYSMIHYFINYLSNKNPDLTTQTLRLDKPPQINLGKNGFFASFVYRDDNKEVIIKNFQKTWFIVEAFQVSMTKSQSDGKRSVSRNQISILSCADADIDQTELYGEKSVALNEDASCIKFDNNAILEGGPGNDDFKFVEIVVRPCDETTSACKTSGIGPYDAIWNNTALNLAAKRVRVVTLQFNFFEAGIKIDDPDSPMLKKINSNYELRMDAFQEKYRTFFFQKYSIKDVKGIFSDSEETIESVSLNDVLTETTTRIPGRSDIEYTVNGKTEARSANYMTIRLQSSNSEYTITRSYTKLIDVFADVGGIAEIATFVIALMYSWHNAIRMEQNMINRGVLVKEEEEQAKEFGKHGFSYFELFKFGFCGCCIKKKKTQRRKEFYEECKQTLEKRLDILDFVKVQGKVGMMQSALLEPYQIKLLSLSVKEKAKTGIDTKYREAKNMSVEEAMVRLEKTGKKKEITRIFDQWILENMERELTKKASDVSENNEIVDVDINEGDNSKDRVVNQSFKRVRQRSVRGPGRLGSKIFGERGFKSKENIG